MYCTWVLVAAPVPVIAFLMSAGGYSWIGTAASAPASRITPRAWPRTMVVRTFRA